MIMIQQKWWDFAPVVGGAGTLCTHCNQNKTDKRGTKGANTFIASSDLQTCTNHI